jgi:hypothetical protein
MNSPLRFHAAPSIRQAAGAIVATAYGLDEAITVLERWALLKGRAALSRVVTCRACRACRYTQMPIARDYSRASQSFIFASHASEAYFSAA